MQIWHVRVEMGVGWAGMGMGMGRLGWVGLGGRVSVSFSFSVSALPFSFPIAIAITLAFRPKPRSNQLCPARPDASIPIRTARIHECMRRHGIGPGDTRRHGMGMRQRVWTLSCLRHVRCANVGKGRIRARSTSSSSSTDRASPLDSLHFLPASIAHGTRTLGPRTPLLDAFAVLVAACETALAADALALGIGGWVATVGHAVDGWLWLGLGERLGWGLELGLRGEQLSGGRVWGMVRCAVCVGGRRQCLGRSRR